MCRGGGGVRRVVADRVPWASGEAIIGAWRRMRPLIWWEVRFWNKTKTHGEQDLITQKAVSWGGTRQHVPALPTCSE